MLRRQFRFFFALCLGTLAIGLTFLLRHPALPVASAAPRVTSFIYLPLVLRNPSAAQHIQDGGFEAGLPNPYWQRSSNQSSPILDNSSIPSPNPTHSGAWKAWLGGNNLVSESLWQTFSVPAGTSSLQISFWYLVNTQETTPQGFDTLAVQLRDSSGTTVLRQLYNLYDVDAGTTWLQKTVNVTPAFAGQTIQIAFIAATDSSNPTSFFIDDVSAQ